MSFWQGQIFSSMAQKERRISPEPLQDRINYISISIIFEQKLANNQILYFLRLISLADNFFFCSQNCIFFFCPLDHLITAHSEDQADVPSSYVSVVKATTKAKFNAKFQSPSYTLGWLDFRSLPSYTSCSVSALHHQSKMFPYPPKKCSSVIKLNLS